jgi:hypothetical protein
MTNIKKGFIITVDDKKYIVIKTKGKGKKKIYYCCDYISNSHKTLTKMENDFEFTEEDNLEIKIISEKFVHSKTYDHDKMKLNIDAYKERANHITRIRHRDDLVNNLLLRVWSEDSDIANEAVKEANKLILEMNKERIGEEKNGK